MKKKKKKTEIQVRNIIETLRNFNNRDADVEEIAEELFVKLQLDEDLSGAFDEFVEMLNFVQSK